MVSDVFEDNDGNLWISTNFNGLHLINDPNFFTYEAFNNVEITDFAVFEDKLLMSIREGVYTICNDQCIKPLAIDSSKIDNIKSLKILDNKIFLRGNRFSYIEGNKIHNVHHHYTAGVETYQNGYLLFSSYSDPIIFNGGYKLLKNTEDRLQIRTTDLSKWNNQYIKATTAGLHSYSLDSLQLNPQPLIKDISVKQLNSQGELLWVLSKTKGIFLLTKDSIYNVNEENGLLTNTINDLFISKEGDVFIAYNYAITKVHFNSKTKSFSFDHTKINSSPSIGKIRAIGSLHDKIWIATKKGLYLFSQASQTQKNKPPTLVFEGITILSKHVTVTEDNQFAYDEHNLKFNFHAIRFRNQNNLSYQFKIDNIDHDYQKSGNSSVAYYNLPAGRHTFRISVDNGEGVFGEEQVYHFTIDKHFANTIWFRSLIVAAIAIGTFIYFRRWNRRRKILYAQERELTKMELKAIRSQMNPHFIFNSMNAIQNLVLSEETEFANEYLTKFSLLMRWTLNYSRKNEISIKEEIEFLDTYLELEMLRFKNNFDYEMIVDEKVDTSFHMIPPFFLQPMIENAIIHGIAPLMKGGFIQIKFMIENNILEIHIEDNGIGRKKSAEINRIKKHTSTGLVNIQDRIDIINQVENRNIRMKIVDLYDGTEALGTLIKIYLPIN
jgi:hypothetical protein